MKTQAGSILITTLWIMAILALLAMGIGFRAGLEVRLSRYYLDDLKARYIANAGAVKAKDYLLKHDTAEDYDTLYECGISLEIDQTPESIFGAQFNKIGDGSFSVSYVISGGEQTVTRYGMMDEDRKFNLNFNNIPLPDKRNEYRRILTLLSPSISQEIISAMLDWQDADDAVSIPGGAESIYYSEQIEHPYECKNADIELNEEILLIKGVTPQLYEEIKRYITVYTSGKININTASQKVLNAILNNQNQEYPFIADKIVDYRRGPDDVEGTADDRPIRSLSDIPSDRLEPAESARLTSMADYFVYKSEVFNIRSTGKIGRIEKIIINIINKNVFI